MFLLYGLERYLIEQQIKKILNDNNIEKIDVSHYNLETCKLEDMIEYASTISILQEKKDIIVYNE